MSNFALWLIVDFAWLRSVKTLRIRILENQEVRVLLRSQKPLI